MSQKIFQINLTRSYRQMGSGWTDVLDTQMGTTFSNIVDSTNTASPVSLQVPNFDSYEDNGGSGYDASIPPYAAQLGFWIDDKTVALKLVDLDSLGTISGVDIKIFSTADNAGAFSGDTSEFYINSDTGNTQGIQAYHSSTGQNFDTFIDFTDQSLDANGDLSVNFLSSGPGDRTIASYLIITVNIDEGGGGDPGDGGESTSGTSGSGLPPWSGNTPQYTITGTLFSDPFTSFNTSNWDVDNEDNAGTVSAASGIMSAQSTLGLTIWNKKKLNGSYEITYKIKDTVDGNDLNAYFQATSGASGYDPVWTTGGEGSEADDMKLYQVVVGAANNTRTDVKRYTGNGSGDRDLISTQYYDDQYLVTPGQWVNMKIIIVDDWVRVEKDGIILTEYEDG